MEPITIGLASIVVLFALVLYGVHIGVALGSVSVVGLWLITGSPNVAVSLVSTTFYSAVKDYVFAVVPLFILVGVILSQAELSQELFEACNVILGRVRGGLAMATVAANAVFAAIVGSSIASAAAFSKISFLPMTRLKYSKGFALGTVAGSSVLGMLIPPSLLFIVFGVLTGESIGQLFMAGIMPGLLLSLIYMVGIAVMVKFRPDLVGQDITPKLTPLEKLRGVSKPWPVILLIILVLGGIYGGYFTPTEAAGVGAIGAFIVGFAMRRLDYPKVQTFMMETGSTAGSILFLLITAQMYSRMIALSGVVNWLNNLVVAANLPAMGVILLFLGVVIILGCIIDSTSILLLTIPLILPIMKNFGIDMIWFGVITVVTVEMGLITPPFGMSVYTVKSSLGDLVTLEEIFGGVMPYLFMMLICLAFLIMFPSISTWLPNLMIKN